MLRLFNHHLARFKLPRKLFFSPISVFNKNETTKQQHLTGHRYLTGFIHQNGPLYISEEVYERIQARLPVVALESTIITHGMAYPHNLETAQKVESIIRANGSVPATIGIIDGNILVGLQPPQLNQLADKVASMSKGKVYKVSRSDLAIVCELKACGGTTVSATSYLANLAGIRIFVTGGIGGVHRDFNTTMDVSADLNELGQTPITVVSAGIKSILDIGKSLELLETNGVCVAVYDGEENQNGQVKFPAFFTPDSGFLVNYNLKTAQSAARIIHIRDQLKLNAGILIAVPNFSEEGQDYKSKLQNALNVATKEMSELNVRGKQVTPYLLARINELTGGESLKLNQQLIENNAKVGAQISVEFYRICKNEFEANSCDPTFSLSKRSLHDDQFLGSSTNANKAAVNFDSCLTSDRLNQNNSSMSSESFPVVIGGSIFDIISKASPNSTIKLDGSTYPGKVQTSLGGVGRNISDAILRLGQRCMLITAVGDDQQGKLVTTNNSNMISSGIRVLDDLPTSACSVTIGGDGECLLLLGDLRAHKFIDTKFVSQFERQLSQAPIVIIDSNVPLSTMDYVLQVCRHHKVPVWFDPTDTSVATKVWQSDNLEAVKFISPNFNELQTIRQYIFGPDSDVTSGNNLKRDEIINISLNYSSKVLDKFPSIHGILVKIGKHGIVYSSRDLNLDSIVKLGPNSSLYGYSSNSNQSHHIELKAIDQVVNVSGAGDCMVGTIAFGLIKKFSIRQSLNLGLKAARLSVKVQDTIPDNISEILLEN